MWQTAPVGHSSAAHTDFNAVIAVNLAGFFHITTRTIRHMLDRGRGHVVNVSTTLVEHASAKVPAALATLTKGA